MPRSYATQTLSRTDNNRHNNSVINTVSKEKGLEREEDCFFSWNDFQDEMDASDFLTADFQRVNISGEDSSGVPVEDLHSAAELLTRALNIREKYMRVSHQEFPANVERYNLYIRQYSPSVQVPRHDEGQARNRARHDYKQGNDCGYMTSITKMFHTPVKCSISLDDGKWHRSPKLDIPCNVAYPCSYPFETCTSESQYLWN